MTTQPPGGPKAPARVKLLAAGLVFAALLVIFAVVEAGLRVHANVVKARATPDGSSESWIVPDEELGYRLRPGRAYVNAHGLPNPPIGPKERFRVLFLGDSVLFGRANLVRDLEALLARDGRLRPVELINAGVPGYTNYQQLTYLKRSGLALQPDLVGFVFVLNDLHRILHTPEREMFFRARRREAMNSVDHWAIRLGRRSLLLQWLRRNAAVAGDVIELYQRGGYSFEYNPDFNPAWKDAPWRVIEGQLAEARSIGETSGFRLFLAVMPYGEQYRRDYLARDPGYVGKPQRMLGEICERLGIPYLDLMPDIDPASDLKQDGIHLTEAGRSKVAGRLAEFLRGQKLLPAK
jgi:lysophospholipase L1-like esterase